MTNPTNQQIAAGLTKINDVLKRAPKDDIVVNMMSTIWDRDNVCGTPACFAGTYGALTGVPHRCSYADVACIMARLCGFEKTETNNDGWALDVSEEHMADWARGNPEIWGNTKGGRMFDGRAAFMPEGSDDDRSSDIPLADVIAWIDGVIGRLNA